MNARREAWAKEHGPIPKGWVVHNLNGDPSDLRPENLAAVPREPAYIVVAPYRERIKHLELKLKQGKDNA